MRMAVRKKCPNFRHSMLRAPASHTIGCNFDMVRADTSNSLGTCLALLQAAGSHSIRSNCDMVRADASTWCAEQPRGMPG